MMTHLTMQKTLPLLDLSQLDGDARQRRAASTICARRPRRQFFSICAATAWTARWYGWRRAVLRLPEADSWRCRWCIRRTFAVTTGRQRNSRAGSLTGAN